MSNGKAIAEAFHEAGGISPRERLCQLADAALDAYPQNFAAAVTHLGNALNKANKAALECALNTARDAQLRALLSLQWQKRNAAKRTAPRPAGGGQKQDDTRTELAPASSPTPARAAGADHLSGDLHPPPVRTGPLITVTDRLDIETRASAGGGHSSSETQSTSAPATSSPNSDAGRGPLLVANQVDHAAPGAADRRTLSSIAAIGAIARQSILDTEYIGDHRLGDLTCEQIDAEADRLVTITRPLLRWRGMCTAGGNRDLWGCLGHERFRSWPAAAGAIRKRGKRGRAFRRGRLTVFRCLICRGFHIGRTEEA